MTNDKMARLRTAYEEYMRVAFGNDDGGVRIDNLVNKRWPNTPAGACRRRASESRKLIFEAEADVKEDMAEAEVWAALADLMKP